MLNWPSISLCHKKYLGNELSVYPRAALAQIGGLFLFTTRTATPVAAQEAHIRVNVGVAAAKPGDLIDIPLTLSGDKDGLVGNLVVQMGVPQRILSYTDVEPGLAV